jgi:hypothetical protein
MVNTALKKSCDVVAGTNLKEPQNKMYFEFSIKSCHFSKRFERLISFHRRS